jgi:hypothetical protein
MIMIIVQDSGTTPDMQAIAGSIAGGAHERWLALNAHIQQAYGAKPQITYSSCSAKPGWNVKYKKSGKALCTLYPEPESFTALVVTGVSDMEKFMLMRALFSDILNALYDRTQLFNNTKWLMIGIKDDCLLDDVKKLLQLKTSK